MTEALDQRDEARVERDRLRDKLRYLRACAHLFPHVNTDQATCKEIGLPDAEDVWCLGCTIGSTVDEFDAELLDGDDDEHDARARGWIEDYDQREAAAFDEWEEAHGQRAVDG